MDVDAPMCSKGSRKPDITLTVSLVSPRSLEVLCCSRLLTAHMFAVLRCLTFILIRMSSLTTYLRQYVLR